MEKKVYFKLHKVKKQWVTIAVTGLALGLSFASLGYVSAAEQTHPVLLKLTLNKLFVRKSLLLLAVKS